MSQFGLYTRDISEVEGYLLDRLYCSRLDEYVPLSLDMHPPSIKKSLSIKVGCR